MLFIDSICWVIFLNYMYTWTFFSFWQQIEDWLAHGKTLWLLGLCSIEQRFQLIGFEQSVFLQTDRRLIKLLETESVNETMKLLF